jgi:type VI protein secretion system component VasK
VLKSFEYWLLCNLGAVAIILVGVNVWLYSGNRTSQAEVNTRAQYIQQTTTFNDVYQQMAKALAELAVKNHDDQIRAMLGQEGFTINAPATPPAKSGAAPPAKGKP